MWGWLLALLSWAHLQLVEPVVRWWEEVVLGSWEEWLLALVRQGFEETTRFLNALGTWFLSLFNQQSYRDQLRRAWDENSWQQWWGEVATRPSTLNALVANLVAQQQRQEQQQQQQQENDHPSSNGSACTQAPLDSLSASTRPSAGAPPAAGSNVADITHVSTGAPSSGDGPTRPATGSSPTPTNAAAAAWWPRPPRMSRGRNGRTGGVAANARIDRPVVFVQHSGMGILDELAKRRHGLIEDAKMAAQLAVSRAFEIARTTVRAVLFLPSREALQHPDGLGRREGALAAGQPGGSEGDASLNGGTNDLATGGSGRARREGPASAGCASTRAAHKAHIHRSKSAHVSIAELAYKPGAGAGAASVKMSRRGLRRSQSHGRLNSAALFNHHAAEAPSDALSVIRATGYPHELHVVTTADGYVLRMERIPRPGARDTVFFMHGVLDTSMAWVSGGVTGSQAFAAWEAGFDVWLGNSRGNAPRQHQDPACRGRRYWQYNINHMGMYDIAAQLDHIHNIKCAELGAGTVTLDLDHLGPLAGNLLASKGGLSASGGVGRFGATSADAALGGAALLPDRAASAFAAHLGGPQGPASGPRVPGTHGGLRTAARMRPSNSDGNLFRWGSCNSGVSSCNGDPGAAAPGQSAPSASSPQPGALQDLPDPRAAACGTSEGGNEPPLAPSTPRSALATPEQARLSAEGPTPADGARSKRPHGPPSASARSGSTGGVGEDDPGRVQVVRAVSCGPCLNIPTDEEREEEGGDGDGGRATSPEAELLQRARKEAPAGPGQAPLSPASLPQPGRPSTVRSPAVSSREPTPPTPVRQKAVTLTVMPPPPMLSGPDAAAADGGSPLPLRTTFTLEAKTRTDFSAAAAGLQAAGAGDGGLVQGGGLAARKSAGNQAAGVDRDPQSAGGAVGTAASSVLDAVGSLLGPAADAVTAAVASAAATAGAAAATAGAAIATAAVSASQLLHSTPHRAGSLPAAQTAASPFAATALAEYVGPAAAAAAAAASSAGAADVEQCTAGGGAAATAAASARGPSAATTPATLVPTQLAGATVSVPAPAPSQPHALPTTNGAAPFRRVLSTDQLSSHQSFSRSAFGSAASFIPPERAASGVSLGQGSAGGYGPGAASGLSSAGSSGTLGSQLHLHHLPAQASEPVGRVAGGPAAAFRRHAAGASAGSGSGPGGPPCPYKLRCVAHSLGGMSMLIHLINRLREGRPHHVSRLLLLTPAGFHRHYPKAAQPVIWVLPVVTRLLRALFGRSFSFPLYIPTPLARAVTFKLLLSASRIPGLGELLRMCYKAMLDGDISQWDRALQMPHYNAEDMPAISADQVLHLTQLVASDSFRLYDYGSPAANAAHYGSAAPPDVAAEYWRLDLPVHLVAGRRDGIIPQPNILRHLEAMRAQGVAVSYREYDFGHLDFTFGVKEELRMYMMKVLRM